MANQTTGFGRGCGQTGRPSALISESTSSGVKRTTSVLRKVGAPEGEVPWS